MITRDGRQVRIFCADGGGPWPVMGRTLEESGIWVGHRWTRRGGAIDDDDGDDIHPDSLPEFQTAIAGGDGWRPIAEAPKDGTKLLLHNKVTKETVTASWMKSAVDGGEAWVQARAREDSIGQVAILFSYPTHYRVLPAPPEAA